MKKLFSYFTAAVLLMLSNAVFAATRTIALEVQNMTCSACPITVKKALQKVNGVSKVDVSFEKKEAVVTFDDSKATVEALTTATGNAGYPSGVRK